MAPKILFVSLAMNQTRFFEGVGRVLRECGYAVAHLCFHEPSWEYLRDNGVRAYNAFDPRYADASTIRLEDFGIENINLMLSHEKAAFEVRDSDRLMRKLRSYLAAANAVIDDWLRPDSQPTVVVQELGGFLSNVATFHAARSAGIDNIFIEPSFFRGRIFFVRNSFAAPVVSGAARSGSAETRDVVRKYLEQVIAQQRIVIPTKDTHHYRRPLYKLLDGTNWRRLFEKSRDKLIYRKQEEFSYIGGHVRRYLRMLINSQRLRRFYRSLDEVEPFIYYPLHVPADAALTIRSPVYLDQYALLDFLARSVPITHRVVIKEHPAMVGAIDFRRVRELLRRRDNIVLLDPGINNHEVVRRAAAVVTVNSKAGAEALVGGTPVIVLGDAFYASAPSVARVGALQELPLVLRSMITKPPAVNRDDVAEFFERVWQQSHPGELYDCSPSNVRAFGDSLASCLDTGDNCGRRAGGAD